MTKEIKIKIKVPEFGKIFFGWFLFVKKYNLIAFKIFLNDLRTKKKRGIVALLLSCGAFYLWGISSALLWLLFLLFLVYEWENRIIGFFALISLVSCPVLLSLKKDVMAEITAVYAYFFLVMTVMLQIAEYKRHPDRFPEDEEVEEKPEIKVLKKKKVKISLINKYVKIGLASLIIIFIGGGVFSYMNKAKVEDNNTGNEDFIAEEAREEDDKEERISKESVNLILLNGNGLEDAVDNFADDLKKNGFAVKNAGKADNFDYEKTVIEYSPANKAKADYINGVLGGKLELREVESDSDEITIILGKDYLGIFIWTD